MAGLFLIREFVKSCAGRFKTRELFPTVVVAGVRQGDFLVLSGDVVSPR